MSKIMGWFVPVVLAIMCVMAISGLVASVIVERVYIMHETHTSEGGKVYGFHYTQAGLGRGAWLRAGDGRRYVIKDYEDAKAKLDSLNKVVGDE